MRTPVLASLHSLHASARRALPPLNDGPAVEHFVVVQDGECALGQFGAGEVLVCRGEAHDGDRVVLVARGHGRPRVGTVRRGRLLGDAGEPCHPDRWRVAGRLVGTWRPRGEGWVCALVDAEVGAGSVHAALADRRVPQVQLSLFEAAA